MVFNRSIQAISENMSAIHVQVKLTNTIDEALVRRGLLNPNLLQVYKVQSLIDTGGVRTVLPLDIVQQLGLKIRSETRVKDADERE